MYMFLIIIIDNVIARCECTNYVSNSGFGNCEKDFGGKGPICYVTQPSNCKDVRGSVSERDKGKQFSWEACQNRGEVSLCRLQDFHLSITLLQYLTKTILIEAFYC